VDRSSIMLEYVALDTVYFIVIEPTLIFFYEAHQKSDGILRGSLVKYVSELSYLIMSTHGNINIFAFYSRRACVMVTCRLAGLLLMHICIFAAKSVYLSHTVQDSSCSNAGTEHHYLRDARFYGCVCLFDTKDVI
jgi:hypothetical protein